MSERDSGMTTARRRTWVRLAVAVLLVAVLALLPWIGSSFTVFVATRILILGIFAMAFDLVFGFGGMPSLGHAAFYGLGAYVVGLGITRWGWGAGTVLVVAILGAAVLGLVTGMLTLRTRGIYLLLLTLAIGEAVWAVAFQQVSLTRGDNGIANIGRDTLPEVVRSTNGFYLLALAVFVVVYLVLRWYTRSSFGRVLVGARESESRMAAFGYRVGAYRVAAFTVSAALASIAGVLSAYLIEFVNPDVLDWPVSAEILLVTILGGAGTIVGPAVGAGFLITFETLVSQYSERWMLALGVVYIVVILFLPEGLASLGRRVRRRLGRQGPVADRDESDEEERLERASETALASLEAGRTDVAPIPDPGRDAQPAIETRGLSCYFGGVAAVDRLDLTIARGERRAIIGPNGAGKTTLFRLISGELRPTEGAVSILGTDVTKWPEYRRARLGVSRTFQITNLMRRLTVHENVLLAVAAGAGKRYELRDLERDPELRERTRDLLASWRLEAYSGEPADEIPYGAQKLLEIVLALATEPEILLLDEPTAGLAPGEAAQVIDILRQMPESVTLMLIEHDMDVAFGVADRVTVVVDGSELVTGSPEEVRSSPEVLAAYMRQVTQ